MLAGCPDAGKQIEPAVKPEKPAYSFSFGVASHKMAFTKGGTYTRAVIETNKPTGDARAITYASSDNKIATVGAAGEVTFVTPGTVTITATNTAEAGHEEAVARYILYITTKPATKADLVAEITRATTAHGNEVDLNYIDTADITDMSWLFGSHGKNGYGLNKFNGDISKWDVSNVTNTSRMFVNATSFNGDISEWDVSQVTTMRSMFYGATAFNQNISGWDVSQVTNMRTMFDMARAFDQNISKWKVLRVTNMNGMFQDAAAFNQDISGWDVSQVTTMKAMFYGAKAFNQNMPNWKTSKVTTMYAIFYNATAFDGDISDWDVSEVTNMGFMFQGARAFNQDISRWKVSKVTDMSYMFDGAKAFDQDISSWDVSQVTDITAMFQGAWAFTQNLDAWGQRINPAIRANSDHNTHNIFVGSGLTGNLPSWCRSATQCF